MKDESSEDDSDVGCPICDSTGDCDHLLLFFDVTFNFVEGGVVDPDEFSGIVARAFAQAIKEGRSPRWKNFWIADLFSQIDDEEAAAMAAADEPELSEPLPLDFIFELLDKAGGWEHPGRLFSQSGACCESAVRVSWAKRPEAVFKKAKKLLESQLKQDLRPKPRKRAAKKKKKGGS